jgi:hypothetical protein
MRISTPFRRGATWAILPWVVTITYLLAFIVVLVRRIVWPVGDATDVIEPGILALPWSLLLAWEIIGVKRDGAFAVVAVSGSVNAALIFFLSRWALSVWRRPLTVVSLSADSCPEPNDSNRRD